MMCRVCNLKEGASLTGLHSLKLAELFLVEVLGSTPEELDNAIAAQTNLHRLHVRGGSPVDARLRSADACAEQVPCICLTHVDIDLLRTRRLKAAVPLHPPSSPLPSCPACGSCRVSKTCILLHLVAGPIMCLFVRCE